MKIKIILAKICIDLFLSCFSQMIFAEKEMDDLILIKLRTTQVIDLSLYPEGLKQCQIISDETKEFKNGNTFVMLYPEAKGSNYSMAYSSVGILVPSVLTADSAMELLFKIYAAKMQLASKVSVLFPEGVNLSDIFPHDLPFKILLKASQADEVYLGNKKVDLLSVATIKSPIPLGLPYLIAGDSHPELQNDLAKILGKKSYSVKELMGLDISGQTTYLIAPPKSPSNESFLQTLSDIYRLTCEKKSFVHVVSSYLPYARSDKVEFEYGVGAQGRLVANLLESLGMGAITVVRPHVPQSMGFFSVPSFDLKGRKTITRYLQSLASEVEIVVSPDAGFQKDATKYADELKLPVFVMNKQRSITGETRLIKSTSMDPLRGKVVVVIDDEASGGGTLAKVAKVLKENGAKTVYGVITHLTGSARSLMACKGRFLEDMIVTNTLPIPEDIRTSLTVVSVAPEIAEHIFSLEKKSKKMRAAFDFGSSKLKLTVALVDDGSKVLEVKKKAYFKLPIMRDMIEKRSSSLSDEMMGRILKTISECKGELDRNYPGISYRLLATEGLRKADNSELILERIRSLGIHASVVSQDEEGFLGFRTGEILSGPENSQEKLVWDHGGGSFQISYKESDGSSKSYKGFIGSVGAAKYLVETIQGGLLKGSKFFEVKEKEALRFIEEIGAIIPTPNEEFKNFLERKPFVIGLGGETSVLGMASKMTKKSSFTKKDLWESIKNHFNQSKDSLKALYPGTSVDTMIPRALMAYTVMAKTGINQITWRKTEGSTLAILTESKYWGSN